jgi:hypothetical protein
LVGRLKFAETGQLAAGVIARGEIGAVSIDYRVAEWRVTDGDGNLIDPERGRIA